MGQLERQHAIDDTVHCRADGVDVDAESIHALVLFESEQLGGKHRATQPVERAGVIPTFVERKPGALLKAGGQVVAKHGGRDGVLARSMGQLAHSQHAGNRASADVSRACRTVDELPANRFVIERARHHAVDERSFVGRKPNTMEQDCRLFSSTDTPEQVDAFIDTASMHAGGDDANRVEQTDLESLDCLFGQIIKMRVDGELRVFPRHIHSASLLACKQALL